MITCYNSSTVARAQAVLHFRAYIASPPAWNAPSHPFLFTLSTNAPAPSLHFSSFFSGSAGYLSAPTRSGVAPRHSLHARLPSSAENIPCPSAAVYSTRTARDAGWDDGMRCGGTGEGRIQGGEVELTEDVGWEKIWRPRSGSTVSPLRHQKTLVRSVCCSRPFMPHSSNFQKKGRAYNYHTHKQRSPGSQ